MSRRRGYYISRCRMREERRSPIDHIRNRVEVDEEEEGITALPPTTDNTR
jgi:hypothetical protein